MKINIAEILREYPIGTKLYSPLCGECTLHEVVKDKIFIRTCSNERIVIFDEYGRYFNDSECLLFPSKDNRDWNKFKVDKSKFDPKTLKPFDKVLVRGKEIAWKCGLFSHIDVKPLNNINVQCAGCSYLYCIPYNEETKHLIGTTEEPNEYYKYWED